MKCPKDIIDKGGIIHLATGEVQLGYFIVEKLGKKKIYLGPVYSFYEFKTEYEKRYND